MYCYGTSNLILDKRIVLGDIILRQWKILPLTFLELRERGYKKCPIKIGQIQFSTSIWLDLSHQSFTQIMRKLPNYPQSPNSIPIPLMNIAHLVNIMTPFCFSGPPSCLALFYNDGGEDGDEVLYGTADGKVGLVQLTR